MSAPGTLATPLFPLGYGFIATLMVLTGALVARVNNVAVCRSARWWSLACLAGGAALFVGLVLQVRLGTMGLMLRIVLTMGSSQLMVASLQCFCADECPKPVVAPRHGADWWPVVGIAAVCLAIVALPGLPKQRIAAVLAFLLLNGWVLAEIRTLRRLYPGAGLSLMEGVSWLVLLANGSRLAALSLLPATESAPPEWPDWASQLVLLTLLELRLALYLALQQGAQVRAQAELTRANQQLETLVAEREQLLDALSLRVRASTLGTMSTALVRALQEPLEQVLAHAQQAQTHLLAGPGIPPAEGPQAVLADVLTGLMASARTADEVMHALYTYFETGPLAQQTHLGNVFLDDLLTELDRLMRPEAELQHVALEFVPHAAGLRVQGNRTQLRQILRNLLSNAIRAAGSVPALERALVRPARVWLEVQVQPAGIAVIVTDTGPGFAVLPDQGARRLFETSSPGGLGVGLWLCEQLAHANQGGLHVANAPAGGGTVLLLLPKALVDYEQGLKL